MLFINDVTGAKILQLHVIHTNINYLRSINVIFDYDNTLCASIMEVVC